MTWSCSPSRCATERPTGRRNVGKTYQRKKETRTDEQPTYAMTELPTSQQRRELKTDVCEEC